MQYFVPLTDTLRKRVSSKGSDPKVKKKVTKAMVRVAEWLTYFEDMLAENQADQLAIEKIEKEILREGTCLPKKDTDEATRTEATTAVDDIS
ncbi:hypothetical protein F0562_005486 [Nyssa sinensis]|uniref:Uncharacterized protein n=1 Tax=Nyssa sinensis TaxID=561372 RepID=A0A5J5AJR6_9ASTE|nr:hypothetical protein F0562_005486 [Nyssa sinensis]